MVRPAGAEAHRAGEAGKWLNTAEGWARANLLYEKANRPPKAGSLKEALFLHVWLKRQERDVAMVRVVAQGLAIIASDGKAIGDAFKSFINAVFPFMGDVQADSDKALIERMKKEAAAGVVQFTVEQVSPLMNRAKVLSAPDEFRKKLTDAARKKGLR